MATAFWEILLFAILMMTCLAFMGIMSCREQLGRKSQILRKKIKTAPFVGFDERLAGC